MMATTSDTIHASYGEAFAQFANRLTAPERAARAAAFDEFVRHGLPDDAIERWHYTNLSAFPKQPVRLATHATPDVARWQLADCDEHVFVNGHRIAGDASASSATLASVDAHAGLAGLHRAFAAPGLQLVVAKNFALPRPVHLLTLSDAGDAGEMTQDMAHLAHRIALALQRR